MTEILQAYSQAVDNTLVKFYTEENLPVEETLEVRDTIMASLAVFLCHRNIMVVPTELRKAFSSLDEIENIRGELKSAIVDTLFMTRDKDGNLPESLFAIGSEKWNTLVQAINATLKYNIYRARISRLTTQMPSSLLSGAMDNDKSEISRSYLNEQFEVTGMWIPTKDRQELILKVHPTVAVFRGATLDSMSFARVGVQPVKGEMYTDVFMKEGSILQQMVKCFSDVLEDNDHLLLAPISLPTQLGDPETYTVILQPENENYGLNISKRINDIIEEGHDSLSLALIEVVDELRDNEEWLKDPEPSSDQLVSAISDIHADNYLEEVSKSIVSLLNAYNLKV